MFPKALRNTLFAVLTVLLIWIAGWACVLSWYGYKYSLFYMKMYFTISQPVRVLFIGNSFTSYTLLDNMPQMLEEITYYDKDSPRKIVTSVDVTFGEHFDGHIKAGILNKIHRGEWDYVVLQDCSFCSSKPYSQRAAEAGLTILAQHIRDSGAVPVLFSEWATQPGSPDYKRFPDYGTFELQQNYITQHSRTLAKRNGMRLVEAGEYWRRAMRLHPGISLYAPDGFHDNVNGAYLNAVALHAFFTGHEPAADTYIPPAIDPTIGSILISTAKSGAK